MYLDVLQPGDTFPMMMRKMVIAITAIVGIVPMIILIQLVMGITTPNSTSYARFISSVIIMIGSWIYVKWTHTAPTWLMVSWINSLSVITVFNMLSTPNGPYEFVFIALIIILLVCKLDKVNLTVPVTALLVFGYNFSLGRTGAPYPLMMLPDGADSPPRNLIISYAQGIVIVLMALYGVHLQTEEFTRASLAATVANEMSLEVSQKLAVYDTDGARAVLAAYASRDQVEGALLTSFGTIVMNLELYRPHLPQAILQTHEDMPTDNKKHGIC